MPDLSSLQHMTSAIANGEAGIMEPNPNLSDPHFIGFVSSSQEMTANNTCIFIDHVNSGGIKIDTALYTRSYNVKGNSNYGNDVHGLTRYYGTPETLVYNTL